LREYSTNKERERENSNQTDFLKRNMQIIQEISTGSRTNREEKEKEGEKENQIKLMNRKRIKQ